MIEDTLSRRKFLSASLALSVGASLSSSANAYPKHFGLTWRQFAVQMKHLSQEYEAGRVTQEQLGWRGLHWLQMLDIKDKSFVRAVEQSYESGNDFWLWQRMLKFDTLNGGILNIDDSKTVQLHDHPGATGILRMISGEVEVWQYDLDDSEITSETDEQNQEQAHVKLKRVAHLLLRAGDTAVLTAKRGNIHALRSSTAESSMLDFFIPPYQKSQRSWYQPLDEDWENRTSLSCLAIPEHEFLQA